MRMLIGLKMAGATLALLAATAIALPAQTFTTLHSFDSTDGQVPNAGLVQATDGNLYGTTVGGGANGMNDGTVFRITPSGALTTLYSFCSQSGCADSVNPYGTLVQATNGYLYGTTYYGGTLGEGAVFKVTPSGKLTALYSFGSQSMDGLYPFTALVEATNGNLYGTTYYGGANANGTVFQITTNGALTTLYSFCTQTNCTDGRYPEAGLAQGTDGNLYGTTEGGGANQYGTIFKMTPSGALKTLYSFCSQGWPCSDGIWPFAGLVQASDGNLYGTTTAGGANGGGTVFRVSPSGALATVYSFCSQSACPDGEFPREALIQATDGNLYGTTELGGVNGDGTLFKISLSGTLTTLYNFCPQSDCPDGANPWAGLVQATDGTLYGTTLYGGANSLGTVFSLSVGLGPFVETQPAFGSVGKSIRILGTNLTDATSVTFNGTPAVFTVFSSSLIGATVPEGATSGKVRVTTPSGTLTSNVPFRVRQ